ncbi:hypothetical protein [Lacisediminihabitans changchengi]|uniref:Uncharacterized protein n=1 Tax=Lacisediminihabitans changchengi TaxID=2787634 RepID=A0A934SH41_9MICO|nr:hypothetical protein [Lacisediminihabitans changchengi]MBK4346521.1 hypothetical protein [Lacisediminihabitans changchengi]
MTAWQDQPPLSRRQVRQNERNGSADGQLEVDSARPREGWDVDARRAATPENVAAGDATGTAGDNAAATDAASADHATGRAVDQSAVTRPAVAGGRRAQRAVGPATVDDVAAETPEAGNPEQTPYRVRDFSPEQRPRLTAPESAGWAPPVTPSDLDNRAQSAAFPPPASPTAVVMPPIVPVAPVAGTAETSVVPLTRRERRALEQRGLVRPPVEFAPVAAPAAESSAIAAAELPAAFDDLLAPTSTAPVQADVVETVAPPALVDPLISPATSSSDVAAQNLVLGESLSLLDLPAEEQASAAPVRLRDRFRRQSAPVETAAVEDDEVIVAEIVEAPVAPKAPELPASAVAQPAPSAEARLAPQPVDQAPVAPAPVITPASAPVAESPAEPSTETGSFVPPVGHWSTQASIDDDEQFQQQPLARNIGATSGAITTNALVIPSLPSEELLRPLGATGEILITGSIDLPRSMGATGAHPARYDHSDVDALLDADDREDAHPESAPVRAIRAVSTHTSTRGVMDARKPKGNSRLPIIFGIIGAALVVGIVALVVAGMVFKIF